MTNYFDCNPVDCQENWEYLGQEADGVFETRIEFDEAHIARMVAKDTKEEQSSFSRLRPNRKRDISIERRRGENEGGACDGDSGVLDKPWDGHGTASAFRAAR